MTSLTISSFFCRSISQTWPRFKSLSTQFTCSLRISVFQWRSFNASDLSSTMRTLTLLKEQKEFTSRLDHKTSIMLWTSLQLCTTVYSVCQELSAWKQVIRVDCLTGSKHGTMECSLWSNKCGDLEFEHVLKLILVFHWRDTFNGCHVNAHVLPLSRTLLFSEHTQRKHTASAWLGDSSCHSRGHQVTDAAAKINKG